MMYFQEIGWAWSREVRCSEGSLWAVVKMRAWICLVLVVK